MNMVELSVKNYRGLRDVTIPLSRFGCLIGENNSGKSSLLQALSLFFSGTKLEPSHFFDGFKPIRIAVTFEGIGDADLARLVEEHRTRVAEIIKNGHLVLVRHYGTDGRSSLRYSTLTPNDARFSSDSIADFIKGQRQGQKFVDSVVKNFPELAGRVDIKMDQNAVKQKIQELADSLPNDHKTITDQVLPTGIDKSIKAMLPDPIYVPAVKDLADDIKTTESTPFGKILAILLPVVESKLPDVQRLFEELNTKLNRVTQADGTVTDRRLAEVKLIESTVEKYVRESFTETALRIEIPPPELKTVLSSARIHADDGVDGLIDSKGDGLRRATIFAVLRAYVDIKSQLATAPTPSKEPALVPNPAQQQTKSAPDSYMLLFEEPELFLHPKAQHMLFDTLRVFAKEHHVLVTTHSPMFFGPGATETFAKLRKLSDVKVAPHPYTKVYPVNLLDVTAKDQFQIICFENNNAAFFADTVVLVEGDSDYLVLPHIAKTLDISWDEAKVPVLFVRITGKGNIRRYRDFFAHFGVRVLVIADLDLLLGGFNHIDPDSVIQAARDNLLAKVDEQIGNDPGAPSAKEAKEAHNSGELRGLWQRVKEFREKLKAGDCTQEEHDQVVEAFFAWQRKPDRLAVLQTSTEAQILQLKHALLEKLRAVGVYVLERGTIEEYYPTTITGPDKPSRAQDFCAKVVTREDVLACCGEQIIIKDGETSYAKEFELIFQSIFRI